MKPRTRIVVVAIVVLSMSVPILGQFAQGRGGGRRGSFDSEAMTKMRDRIEAVRLGSVGAMFSFDIELDEEGLAKPRPIFATAWDQRHEILISAEEHDAWGEAKDKMKTLWKETKAQVKALLKKEHWNGYEDALRSLERLTRIERPSRF